MVAKQANQKFFKKAVDMYETEMRKLLMPNDLEDTLKQWHERCAASALDFFSKNALNYGQTLKVGAFCKSQILALLILFHWIIVTKLSFV